MRLVLLYGLSLAVLRAVVGFGLGKWAQSNPEADMLVLADAPTMAIYAALSLLGFEVEIINASDGRFLLAGIAVWFFLGLMLGALLSWIRSRQK